MAAAAYITAPSTVVLKSNRYALLSVPPEQDPSVPFVLPETRFPIGFTTFTPEYLDTTMTAFTGVPEKVAVTGPPPLGVPCAIHTSTLV